MAIIWAIWVRSGAGAPTVSLRGAARNTKTAEQRTTAAKTEKALRQPIRLTRYSVGSVATTSPRAPTDMMPVLERARRSIGTQVAEDL